MGVKCGISHCKEFFSQLAWEVLVVQKVFLGSRKLEVIWKLGWSEFVCETGGVAFCCVRLDVIILSLSSLAPTSPFAF